MFLLLHESSGKFRQLQQQLYGDQESVSLRLGYLIHACTDRRRPKSGQPAMCLMFYMISHHWYHSYTVYFGLYAGLPPVAQADLDRLHRQTSQCEALFAYSTYPKYIFTIFVRGQHLSNTFTMPQLNYLQWRTYVCGACTVRLNDVYIRLWR